MIIMHTLTIEFVKTVIIVTGFVPSMIDYSVAMRCQPLGRTLVLLSCNIWGIIECIGGTCAFLMFHVRFARNMLVHLRETLKCASPIFPILVSLTAREHRILGLSLKHGGCCPQAFTLLACAGHCLHKLVQQGARLQPKYRLRRLGCHQHEPHASQRVSAKIISAHRGNLIRNSIAFNCILGNAFFRCFLTLTSQAHKAYSACYTGSTWAESSLLGTCCMGLPAALWRV